MYDGYVDFRLVDCLINRINSSDYQTHEKITDPFCAGESVIFSIQLFNFEVNPPPFAVVRVPKGTCSLRVPFWLLCHYYMHDMHFCKPFTIRLSPVPPRHLLIFVRCNMPTFTRCVAIIRADARGLFPRRRNASGNSFFIKKNPLIFCDSRIFFARSMVLYGLFKSTADY